MADLTRDAILRDGDLPTRIVEVPEWGGTVTVAGLTGRQRDAFEMLFANWRDKNQNITDLRATVAAWCIIGGDGRRIFNDTSDVQRLGQKSARALDRIFWSVMELSGITRAEMEEMEKNSEAGPNGSSGTD